MRKILFISIILGISLNLYSQSDSSSRINVSADIFNRYVWRGLDYGKAPSIQPTLSFVKNNFEIGTWGSINTVGTYSEIDLYAKYILKSFTIGITDYFIHCEVCQNNTHYLNYSAKTTTHAIEPSLLFKGPDKFPVSIFAAAFVYGNDRAWGYDAEKDSTLKNYYSSYFEIGYNVKCKKNAFDLFMGFTPAAGAYGNTFGVINTGITAYRSVAISEKFSLPMKASLILNPQAGNLYFTLGITI